MLVIGLIIRPIQIIFFLNDFKYRNMSKVRQSRNEFQGDDSSKKQTNKFDFTAMIPQVDMFSFVFWKKLKTPIRYFKII